MLFRGDSAFYVGELVTACRTAGVAVSITINQYSSVVAAIAGIDEAAWTPIRYPKAVWDEQTGAWISDAEIAETPFTAFAADPRHRVAGRLVVRRVRDQNHLDTLFPVWRYHAFFTTSDAPLIETEAIHRRHAVIEHVNDDLKHGPLAHFPSGRFAANAAWLSCAAIAFNLTRAAGCLAGGDHGRARIATLRRRRMESCWVHGRAGYRCRHGHSSGKMASPQRPANLYLREDVILARVAERIGQDVLGELHLEKWSAVVQVIHDRALTIICAPDGCTVTKPAWTRPG
jgi:hypothetical protein